MRDKYVMERHPMWFVFGEHPDGERVDVYDGDRDVLQHVPREIAMTAIDEHNKLVEAICEIVQAFDAAAPEAFTKFWYGPKDAA